jgi:hypothetical protein
VSGYLLTIIGTVLVCSLITAIAPEGKTTASVKGVAKLVCTLAIISPVLRFFKTGSIETLFDKNRQEIFYEEVIDVDGEFIQYYSEMRIRQTEEAIEEELFEKYAISCEVCLDWSMQEEIRIERIIVKVLENVGEEVKGDMRLFLLEKYCEEVLIE